MVLYFTGGEKLRVVTRVRTEDGTHLPLSRGDISAVRLVQADAPEGWILRVPHRAGLAQRRWWSEYAGSEEETTELTGSAAVRAAGKILPKVNLYGGKDRQVQGAVNLIETAGDAERTFRTLSQAPGYVQGAFFDRDASVLKTMQPEIRLALEMAAHEEAELRALAGELEELEEAWREAEEIAAIADMLLMPEEVEEWIRKHRLESGAHFHSVSGLTQQHRTSCLAACTSSSRRIGALCGAVRSNSGSCFASSMIRASASTNASRDSLLSVSVGSIINASRTINGK